MNKTAAFLGILGFLAIGIAGAVILIALGRDAAVIVNFIGPTLAVIIAAALQLNGQQKVVEKQDALQTQQDHIAKVVNGNTSKLISMIPTESLTAEEQAEIDRIAADNDKLSNGGGRHVA